MAYGESGSQLTGQQKIYVAPAGSTPPDVRREPIAPWVLLGTTNGRQSISQSGPLTYKYDNNRLGPIKAVRGMADVVVEFKLPTLDPTDYARVLSRIDNAVTVNGVMTLPLKREFFPYEYSMIIRGQIQSKYGQFPGMYVIPRGVFDGEPRVVTETDGTESLMIVFHALEDYEQEDEDMALGWIKIRVQ